MERCLMQPNAPAMSLLEVHHSQVGCQQRARAHTTADLRRLSPPGASKVAGAACDERHSQRLAKHGQASTLPEAMYEGRHPPVIAQGAT